MRSRGIVALPVAVSGCAIQRAQVAQDARVQMVGMSKEQVLACMGPPASKATEAQTEVWSYNSGDGTIVANGSVSGGNCSGVSASRFCKINMVFAGGAVNAVFIRAQPAALSQPASSAPTLWTPASNLDRNPSIRGTWILERAAKVFFHKDRA